MFYAMIGIGSNDHPPPLYFLSDGKTPDYFPEELRNEHTGQSLLHPHWDTRLSTQMIWFEVFLDQFYNTIPSNSPIAPLVAQAPPNAVFHMMKGCRYQTVTKKWKGKQRDMKDIERSKQLARRAQRKINVSIRIWLKCARLTIISKQKVGARLDVRPHIKALASSDYNFIFHADYMSDEETDEECVKGWCLVVWRPESRASWVCTR
jgi:hypothetical protein